MLCICAYCIFHEYVNIYMWQIYVGKTMHYHKYAPAPARMEEPIKEEGEIEKAYSQLPLKALSYLLDWSGIS